MLKWIEGLLDRLFAVAGALIFSQIPLFIQQYTQRLAGHVAELKLQVAQLMHAASFSGKTLEQLIAKFLASGDPDFVRQGEMMQQTVWRYDHLNTALQHLETSTSLSRSFVFLHQFDWKIAQGTLDSYAFGIVLNWEGGIYIVIGILSGILLYRFLLFNLHILANLCYSLKHMILTTLKTN